MPDDGRKRTPANDSLVNVDDPAEVLYRRKQYGCTEQQLRHAVSMVGVSADKVKQHFKNMSLPKKRWKIGYD